MKGIVPMSKQAFIHATKLRHEAEVCGLLLEGNSDRQIAEKIGVKTRTVKNHMSNLFQHYGITSGYKRVKLALILYHEKLAREKKEELNSGRP